MAEYSSPLMTSSNRVPREKVKHTQHLLVAHVAFLVVAIDKVQKAADNVNATYSLCDVFISKVNGYSLMYSE